MSQTTIAANISDARKGLCNNTAMATIHSFTAKTALTFGLVVQRFSDDEDEQVLAMSALPSADADAIASTTTISTAADTFQTTDFGGAVGQARITPPQRISLVLNDTSDWDATTAIVAGYDADGKEVVEPVPIPNNGNTTVYTLTPMSMVRSIYMPAQSGTCTFTVGTDSTVSGLDRGQYPGVCVYDETVDPLTASTEVTSGTMANVLVAGEIWMQVEAAVTAGDPVFVRVTESGADLRGQVRGTAATSFVRLPRAEFISDQATADGLALVRIW